MTARSFDCLILGQGLAGSWVAMSLARRGWKVGVLDDGAPLAASRVATGLITPLTGKRLVPTWRLEKLLPFALAAYQQQERRLGCQLIDRRPTLRCFDSLDQYEQWQRRARDPRFGAYLGPRIAPGQRVFQIEAPYGGCWLRQGARIEVGRWLHRVRDALWREGAYRCAQIDLRTLVRRREQWELGDWRAPRLVLCAGHRACTHAWMRFVSFRNAKGDLLTVDAPYLSERVHLQTGLSLVGIRRGTAVLGGNYDWDPKWSDPQGRLPTDNFASPQDAKVMRTRMQAQLGQPLVIRAHRAGVRPIIEGRLPLVGALPGQPQLYALNGLASKGTMWAPWLASRLRDILWHQASADPELDALLIPGGAHVR